MIVWPDLEAPEDARYPPSTYSLLKHLFPINRQLVDMVQRVVELQVKAMFLLRNKSAIITPSKTNKSPVLVHCSAGVGRTGTFIALYKLWHDYHDSKVNTLALLPTVVALRSQRCLMVQKSVQYVYIAKCLSCVVSTEEGDYYEVASRAEREDPNLEGDYL